MFHVASFKKFEGKGQAASSILSQYFRMNPSIVGLTVTSSLEGLEVSGKTFDYKDQLKALGGRWNPSRKIWILPVGADLSVLQPLQQEQPKPVPANMQKQIADYMNSYSHLRGVRLRSRHGRCCSEATTKLDDINPQGPMWYVCAKHGNYKSDYDGT